MEHIYTTILTDAKALTKFETFPTWRTLLDFGMIVKVLIQRHRRSNARVNVLAQRSLSQCTHTHQKRYKSFKTANW